MYYAVWMDAGKQRKKSLGTADPSEVQRKFNAFKDQLYSGRIKSIAPGSSVSWAKFVKEFLSSKEFGPKSTHYLYKSACKKASDSWGSIPLKHITRRHIDQFISDLARSGLSAPTINKNLRHLKHALRTAYEWEYLERPIKFPKPVAQVEDTRYISRDGILHIISNIKDPEFADICLFSAVTGMRSGEILRLNWSDIDSPPGYIRISSQQKNKRESRIPINDSAREILDRWRKDIGPVFRINCRHHVSHQFKIAARAAGYGDARFHDLRHSFGVMSVEAGVDIRTLQQLMRHRSITSTLVYASVTPDHLVKSSNKICLKIPSK